MSIKEIFCPECQHRVKLGKHPRQGQRVVCSGCNIGLIVTNDNPVELDSTTSERSKRVKKKINAAAEVACPECSQAIRLQPYTRTGYQFTCEQCQVPLEVVHTNPLEIDVAFMTHVKYHQRYNF